MRRSTGEVIIREADTIWREEGGWFDARWHFSSTATAIPSRWAWVRSASSTTIGSWPALSGRSTRTRTSSRSPTSSRATFSMPIHVGNNGHLEPGAAAGDDVSHRGDLPLREERLP